MESNCPECKSKNIKTIHTEIDNIKCKCLDCEYNFDRKPTIKERDIFNY